MSRMPVDKQAREKRGQEWIWSVVMELAHRGPMTVRDVRRKTTASVATVREYMARLERGGYIERHGLRGQQVTYRLVRPARRAPRLRRDGSELPPTKRENMWRTMRMIGAFDVRALTIAASTDEVAIKKSDAKDYVGHLFAAGYLRQVGAATSGQPYIYRLARNTGPCPPQVQRVNQVYDPNLHEVVWREGDNEQA